MKQIVSVCIGSSCHLKGAYLVIQGLQDIIESRRLEELVELKANFCAGLCQHAVSVRLNEEPCVQVDAERLEQFWADHVEGRL